MVGGRRGPRLEGVECGERDAPHEAEAQAAQLARCAPEMGCFTGREYSIRDEDSYQGRKTRSTTAAAQMMGIRERREEAHQTTAERNAAECKATSHLQAEVAAHQPKPAQFAIWNPPRPTP